MIWLARLILPHRNLIAILALLLSACTSLPEKSDITFGKERFVYALHGTDSPAVVFEAGLGGGMDSWAPIYESVATFTTAFAYNRRGYGESGKPAEAHKNATKGEVTKATGEMVVDAILPGTSTILTLGAIGNRRSLDESAPRSGAAIVEDLHGILKQTGVEPPYLLVGHSLGGLYTMLYAKTFPKEVAGLVLIDSMHPEQTERCKQYLSEKECDPEHYPWWVKTLIKLTPAVIRSEMRGAAETGRQIRAAGHLPSVPMAVISHGKPDSPEQDRMWATLQQELAGESMNSRHIIASKSGHNIQSDQPDLVIQTIKNMVMQARQNMGIPQ